MIRYYGNKKERTRRKRKKKLTELKIFRIARTSSKELAAQTGQNKGGCNNQLRERGAKEISGEWVIHRWEALAGIFMRATERIAGKNFSSPCMPTMLM